MSEIDLSLVADNTQYVRAINEANNANRQLYDNNERRQKREVGLIEDIEQSIKELQEAKKKAYTVEDIEKYNKKLQEAEQHLKEYNEAGKVGNKVQAESAKGSNILRGAMLKLTAAIGGAVAAKRALNAIIKSTQATGDAFTRVMAGAKESLNALAQAAATGDFSNLIGRMRQAYNAGKEYADDMDEIADRVRAVRVRTAQMRAEMTEQMVKLYETETLSLDERERALKKYDELNEQLLEANQENNRLILDAETKRLMGTKNITEEQAKMLLEYVQEYDRLTENELKIAKEIQKTYDDLAKERRRVNEGSLADQIRYAAGQNKVINELLKQWVQHAEFLDKEQNTKVKAWFDLGSAINNFVDTERDAIANALINLADADAQFQTAQRMSTRRSEQIARERKKEFEEQDKAFEESLKKQREYWAKVLAIGEENRQKEIELLEGEDKINAQVAYDVERLRKVEEGLIKEYKLKTDRIQEIQDAITLIELQAELDRAELREQEEEKYLTEYESRAAARMAANRQLMELEYDLIDASEQDKLELKLDFLREDLQNLKDHGDGTYGTQQAIFQKQIALVEKQIQILNSKKDELNLASLLGIDENYIQAIKMGGRELTKVLNQVFAERVRDAERTRALLDRQIQETQFALNAELALLEAGYASNVRAKQEEVERLQAERDKALAQEEKALEIQRKFDEIQQVSSLLTASANIYKSLAKLGPVGVAIASGVIALMFGGFLKAKADAAKLTKLEQGGLIDEHGTIKGKRHSKGGERLLDHVEVEDGEKVGVFNRSASKKFDKHIRFAVEEFNAGRLPLFKGIPDIKPSISVAAVGDTRKLGSIDRKLGDMNEFFKKNGQIIYNKDGARVEKRKNHTRIVRNG